jgi:raffinose/stachyose/melibiose transport system substrate-binding protein
MSKKITLFLVFALVLSLVPVLSLASAQDQVTITWWHIDTAETQTAYWQSLADEYMAANPNVTIEITVLENEAFKSRLVTVMQAGDPPDLFRSWGGGVLWNYAENGLIRNIAPELEGEWKDSFSAQAALELYGQNGEYYGVPYTWGAVGIFYNKDLFAQAGLDPEAPPATWDEFLASVQALKDADITPIAIGQGDRWPGHFWWVYLAVRIGGQDAFLNAYNREGAFTDEPFVQAGEKLAELVALEPFAEGFLGMTYGDSQTLMINEDAAMELMGQWAPGAYAGTDAELGPVLNEKLGWMPFPVVEGGAGNPTDVLGGGDGWAVGANAEDEAVDFLKFLTSAEVETGLISSPLAIAPTVAAAEEAVTDPIIQTILKARNEAPYFQLYYDQFLPPAVATAVLDATEGIFAGTLSPEDAAATIEDSAAMELTE